MSENEAKTNADWPGWPSADDYGLFTEVNLSSRPYGTELEERFAPEPPAHELPGEEPLPPRFVATWDMPTGRFEQDDAQELLERLCKKDGLDARATSRPDSRVTVLGEERRLPFQPGVPQWVLAWRESVSRSRAWGDAQAIRSHLAGRFYLEFLRAWYADPDRDVPESTEVWCEHLYKSCESHGNGRSRDLGDRVEIPLPPNWCGAAASAALVEALRRSGWALQLADDWSPLVHRKDWNLAVTEYLLRLPPRDPFVQDGNPDPKPRAGDILTLMLHEPGVPPGHYAMVLAARMDEPDRGFLYVASGSTGPLRTVAIDLLRVEPCDPALRWPAPGRSPPRPPDGFAWIVELNRTSLLLPTRRLDAYPRAAREQLKVRKIG